MKEIKVRLSQAAIDRLQVHVEEYNAAHETDLALEEWVDLHLREMAISKDIAAMSAGLREQAEQGARQSLQRTLNAERRRLLDVVSVSREPGA